MFGLWRILLYKSTNVSLIVQMGEIVFAWLHNYWKHICASTRIESGHRSKWIII